MEWIAIIVCIALFEWAVPTHIETGAVPEVETYAVSDEMFNQAAQWEIANNKEMTDEKAE